MKFDRMRSAGRGLFTTLRNESGKAVGIIHSCFVSSNRGAFCSNLQPGYLTAGAGVFDMHSGENIPVAEWSDSTCRRRTDADKVFRAWVRDENIREKLIVAARDFEAKLAAKQAQN